MSVKKWTNVTDWDAVDAVLDVQGLCAVLKISEKTALGLLNKGDIKARRVGGRQWRIDKEAVRAYLNGTDALFDAMRRSVAERNADPARMNAWLDDWADRMGGAAV